MTINLFVIANVKQLRTGGSFRNLLPFFRTSWGVGVLNSAIFNSFHNRVELNTFWRTLPSEFRGRGWLNPQPTLGTPLFHTKAEHSIRIKQPAQYHNPEHNILNQAPNTGPTCHIRHVIA